MKATTTSPAKNTIIDRATKYTPLPAVRRRGGVIHQTQYHKLMKKMKYLTVMLLSLCLPLAAAEATPSINVDVTIKSKADYKGTATKTQSRTINTKIANYGSDAVSNVTVKWWIYGHNMKDHKLVVLKEDESKVVIPAKKTIDVTSPEVKVSGTREHKVTSRNGRGKRSRPSTKTVPASGQEYYGYAVEVYLGNTLVSSEYSKQGIKEELHPREN